MGLGAGSKPGVADCRDLSRGQATHLGKAHSGITHSTTGVGEPQSVSIRESPEQRGVLEAQPWQFNSVG